MLVMAKSLGNIGFIFELQSSQYVIESFSFPNEKQFQSTDDIQSEARKLNIRHWDLLANASAHYIIVYASMNRPGRTTLKMTISNNSADEELLFEWRFDIETFVPENYCLPNITNLYG